MANTKVVKLGAVTKIFKGKKVASNSDVNTDRSRRYIQIDDLRNDNNLKFTHDAGIQVEENDVVIAWDGANAGTVGYGLNGVIGSTLAKISIQNGQLLGEFLGRFLQNKFQYLRDRCTGATIPHISRQVLTNLEIPLPSLEEQKRIGRVLAQADSLRQKRQKAISLLDDYLKAVFLEMFGSSAKGFEEWENVKMSELAKKEKGSMRTGPFGSNLKHSEFVDEGIAVIGIDNAVQNKFAWNQRRYITEEKYKLLKNYTLFPGDVIITIMATTGRSAVIPEDIPLCINTKHLAAITLDRELANPYFISYSIHSNPLITDQINRKNRGAIMSGLNLGIIKDLKLKKPPIELQNRFEQLYKRIKKLKQSMLTQSKKLDANFNALMQKSFTSNNIK